MAVSSDGTLYATAIEKAQAPPSGYANARGFYQIYLYAVDADGRIKTKLGGTITWDTGRDVWIRVASWGTAYAVDDSGGLYGLWPDGRGLFRATGMRLSGTPVIDPTGRVFAGGATLVGLDLQGNDLVGWKSSLANTTAPLFGPDGTIYVGSLRSVYALETGGDVRWVRRLDGLSGFALGGQGYVYSAYQERVSCLASDGQLLWDFATEQPIAAGPEVAPDGTVYVVSEAGLVYALDTQGRKLWSFALQSGPYSQITVDAIGSIYVTDRNQNVYKIKNGGRQSWMAQLPAVAGTPEVGPSGEVYVQALNGELYALSTEIRR